MATQTPTFPTASSSSSSSSLPLDAKVETPNVDPATSTQSTTTPNPNVTSCKQCGSSELDSDPSRGDTVCMNCGYVLEESLIVSEVCFEEDGHGGASAVGQFVSSESKGGGGIGLLSHGTGGYHQGVAKESREITLRAAKKKITEVAQQLRLNQHCIDVAFNFFKMALHKQLTKGRKHPLTVAACIYMTCRIEGTPHLLIDFSDVVQMDVYALGRAYIQISRALYINIPAVDPCMYILRFAHKLNLGKKTHEVAMTAIRLVQRMKRDWIHLGRRPSGLCGAALLIASRLHSFSRSVQDIIQVVKVHETTLRKRLVEFGETPSSSLTIEEFMSVDLEEEHDPPSFKMARIKDREHLQKLMEVDLSEEMTDLQCKIEDELQRRRQIRPIKKSSSSLIGEINGTTGLREGDTTTRFIMESTLSTINTIISDEAPQSSGSVKLEKLGQSNATGKNMDMDRILMPPPVTAQQLHGAREPEEECKPEDESGELDFSDIDDKEIDAYIMSDIEAERKRVLWERLNNDYIIAQQKKKELLELAADTKVDKKKKNLKVKDTFHAKTANEAIKIMLTERKMSSKINYDVLRQLATSVYGDDEKAEKDDELVTVIESGPVISSSKRKSWLKLETDQKRGRFIKSEGVISGGHSAELRNDIVDEHDGEDEAEYLEVDEGEAADHEDDDTEELDEHEDVDLEEDEEQEDEGEYLDENDHDAENVDDEIGIIEQPVIVESGPVQYNNANQEEEEEYDEGTLSVRELLTQFRGDEEEEDEYYE